MAIKIVGNVLLYSFEAHEENVCCQTFQENGNPK